jgi:hypothetical protein
MAYLQTCFLFTDLTEKRFTKKLDKLLLAELNISNFKRKFPTKSFVQVFLLLDTVRICMILPSVLVRVFNCVHESLLLYS